MNYHIYYIKINSRRDNSVPHVFHRPCGGRNLGVEILRLTLRVTAAALFHVLVVAADACSYVAASLFGGITPGVLGIKTYLFQGPTGMMQSSPSWFFSLHRYLTFTASKALIWHPHSRREALALQKLSQSPLAKSFSILSHVVKNTWRQATCCISVCS